MAPYFWTCSIMLIFSKIALISWLQKVSIESDQYHTFLFREVEQLAIYQLLPNLTIWECFGWLFSGSELAVSMWAPLQDIHRKSRAFVSPQQYSVIISVDSITTLQSVGCYILLLPVCKVEIQVKRQLFWQVGDDFRMWVIPALWGTFIII